MYPRFKPISLRSILCLGVPEKDRLFMRTTRNYTFRTRLHLDSESYNIICATARLLSKVTRTLFSETQARKKSIPQLKREFIARFGITARQFNSCRMIIEGIIKANTKFLPKRISQLETRKASLKRLLVSTKKQTTLSQLSLHEKKRKLKRLEQKIEALRSDQKSKKVRCCFGGKKLYHAQYFLKENGFLNHSEWREIWKLRRDNQFFLVGSKDETSGNQSCTPIINDDDSISLRIRLPHRLIKDTECNKYIFLHNLKFKYGHRELIQAIEANSAISFRFKYGDKGWEVFATTAVQNGNIVTDSFHGAIGVDINKDHLAIAEIDCKGNIIYKNTFKLLLYGQTHNQRIAAIGDACSQVVARATVTQKPIVLEKLDFEKKKSSKLTPRQSRSLHSLAYGKIREMLISRAFRFGVEIKKVNPAYTSIIGQAKFMNRYGLSVHHAAAMCIARRYYGFSEQPPRVLRYKVRNGAHVAFPLPVRNRGKHVWHLWVKIARKIQAVHVAHIRTLGSIGPPG